LGAVLVGAWAAGARAAGLGAGGVGDNQAWCACCNSIVRPLTNNGEVLPWGVRHFDEIRTNRHCCYETILQYCEVVSKELQFFYSHLYRKLSHALVVLQIFIV